MGRAYAALIARVKSGGMMKSKAVRNGRYGAKLAN
jgi:hypothetical protein